MDVSHASQHISTKKCFCMLIVPHSQFTSHAFLICINMFGMCMGTSLLLKSWVACCFIVKEKNLNIHRLFKQNIHRVICCFLTSLLESYYYSNEIGTF